MIYLIYIDLLYIYIFSYIDIYIYIQDFSLQYNANSLITSDLACSAKAAKPSWRLAVTPGKVKCTRPFFFKWIWYSLPRINECLKKILFASWKSKQLFWQWSDDKTSTKSMVPKRIQRVSGRKSLWTRQAVPSAYCQDWQVMTSGNHNTNTSISSSTSYSLTTPWPSFAYILQLQALN